MGGCLFGCSGGASHCFDGVRTRFIPLGFRGGCIAYRVISKQRLDHFFIVRFMRLYGFDAIEMRFECSVNGAHGTVVAVPQVCGVIVAVQIQAVIIGFGVYSSHFVNPSLEFEFAIG